MSKTIDERPVRFLWEGPLALDQAIALSDPDIDCGLYQIYAHHVVFGPTALVYIGLAVDQTFGARFAQHRDLWLGAENDVHICVGRVQPEYYSSTREWKSLVEDAEALAIYYHSPPYNSKGISSYNRGPIRVQNWGVRGSMLPEFSSSWLQKRPVD